MLLCAVQISTLLLQLTDTYMNLLGCRLLPVGSPMPDELSWWLVSYQIACDCFVRTLMPTVVLVALSTCVIVRLRRVSRRILAAKRKRRHELKQKRGSDRLDWRKMSYLAVLFGMPVKGRLGR